MCYSDVHNLLDPVFNSHGTAASVMELLFRGHLRIGKEKVKTGKVHVTAFIPFPLQHMSVCIHSFRHPGKHL